MVTSDLGACEWFVWDLRRSGLIDRGQLDQIVGDFLRKNPRGEPQGLADYLIQQQVLTAFQSERILSGKSQGLVLGPYILIDAIGQGSMGQVYKASSKTDNQFYAIKVLPRRSMWNVRLARRQVRAFSQITHPAVVPFMDVGTSGGQHYLAWPLVEGETLEAKILREGKLSYVQAAQIGLQVAQGLAVCHQNGIFHGLLKPSNIMIGKDGQTRILDFGIGSLLVENEGESLVDTMSTANTLTSGLDCSSPESILEPSNRTPAGDQYSLGCVLYYCLTGRYPFPEGTAVEKMMAHQLKQPVPIRDLEPSVPEALVEIVTKLMQKAPESRYSDADALVEALQPFANESALPRRSNYGTGSRSHYDIRSRPSSISNMPELPPSTLTPIPKPPQPGSNPLIRQGNMAPPIADRVSGPPATVKGRPTAPASVPPTNVQIPKPGSNAGFGSHAGFGSNPGLGSSPGLVPNPQAGSSHPGVAYGSSMNQRNPVNERDSQYGGTPGWIPEEPRKISFLGFALMIGIASTVMMLVLFLGKNFIFKE